MGKVIVFGSLNMDISIEADKMPQQGETIGGKNLVTSQVERVPIKLLPQLEWVQMFT